MIALIFVWQVNASLIKKLYIWLIFLGKNLQLDGCSAVCAKIEAMLSSQSRAYNFSSLFSIHLRHICVQRKPWWHVY